MISGSIFFPSTTTLVNLARTIRIDWLRFLNMFKFWKTPVRICKIFIEGFGRKSDAGSLGDSYRDKECTVEKSHHFHGDLHSLNQIIQEFYRNNSYRNGNEFIYGISKNYIPDSLQVDPLKDYQRWSPCEY